MIDDVMNWVTHRIFNTKARSSAALIRYRYNILVLLSHSKLTRNLAFFAGIILFGIKPLVTQLHLLKAREWIEFRCLHQTAPPYLAEELVSVSALLRHHRLLSDAPVFQPSAIELFRSPLPSRL